MRTVRFGCGLLGLLALFVILLAAAKPYTEWLWYTHDVRQPGVYLTAYRTRGLLFALAFFPTWALVYFSLRRAFGLSLVYLRAPESVPQVLMSNFLGWLQRRGASVVRFAAPAFAFLIALGLANEWNTYLLARNPQSFGQKDPTYGLDLGFFIFTLPWYRALSNYLFMTLLVTTGLSVLLYVVVQAMASAAKIELGRPHVRLHISLLLAATLLAGAIQTWLKTYEIGLVPSAQFTGAGYAGAFVVGAERIFAVLLVLTAILVLINARLGESYLAAIGGAVGLGAYYLLVLVAAPLFVQRVIVSPQYLSKEAPFAKHAIAMTRFGYGLERVESRDFDVQAEPSQTEVAAAASTLDNVRLWDPNVLRTSFGSQQAIRQYYRFDDVDIDRYPIKGKQTMVMLAPREIDPAGLSATAQNWNNRRLRYTHGYGAVVAQVNEASRDGQPAYLMRDIPVQSIADIPLERPEVYFGDRRDANGYPEDEVAIVNTEVPELAYQTTTRNVDTRWEGGRGVPISGLLSRLAFGLMVMDGNLIVAPNLTSGSRLLMRRNVLERASKVLPFLRFDSDPYLVIYQGRMLWLLDGYSTSSMLPYSATISGPTGSLNYIRNSVKATVDAYTGEVHAYAVEEEEPILRAYRKIYPGLVREMSELPKGLDAHLRYPEDLLTLQSLQLATYHVTDPETFLGNGDAWEIAYQRGSTGYREPIRPYYVQMRLPDERESGFVQILPFSPLGKPTMSGWLAAHCDPGQYGKLTLYKFTSRTPPPGPELMESNFNSDPVVSDINRTYNNEQSEIVVGNLLVIPIGSSVMYVEPLFLRSKTSGLQTAPPLFRVILAFQDRVVVRPTYREALAALFEGGAPAKATEPEKANPSRPGTAAEALRVFDEADKALRAGDFARYGELQKELRRRLEALTK